MDKRLPAFFGGQAFIDRTDSLRSSFGVRYTEL